MRRRRYVLTTLLCILVLSPICSQSNYDRIKIERFSKIEYYHFAIGLDAAIHHNYSISPKFFFGIGSSRNFLNADLGFKYNFRNPFYKSSKENVSIQELVMFISLHLNVIRGKKACLYIGGEIASHWTTNSKHYIHSLDTKITDTRLGNDYFSAYGKIGTKINSWEISLFYEYDLSPSINQKYVYESKEYEYQSLYNSLFERTRLGVGLTYYFPFKL